MNKDKQIKELERSVKEWKANAIAFGCLVLIFVILLVIAGSRSLNRLDRIEDLQTQLSSCQDKIPVCDFKDGYWGFEVRCDYTGWGQEVMDKHHYLTEEECNLWLEKWLDAKYCEVIE